jgi:hypothetical protein
MTDDREPAAETPAAPVGGGLFDRIADPGITTQWWYNTRTGEVEEGRLSPAPYRAGPFTSRADVASGAYPAPEHEYDD